MKLDQLRNRKIGLLGYGREAAVTLRVLRERVPASDVEVWLEGSAVPAPVPVRSGPFDEGLLDFDVLIRSPGIPVLHTALETFRATGRPIVSPTSIWLAERPDVKVVAVTGSKGKSTTASLLAHILEQADCRPLLAGNIGIPVLAHLDTSADLAVLELSSYQLSDLTGRVHLGLFTRLFPEHGDWHGGVEHYYASKMRMIDLLGGGPLLINAVDPVLHQATAGVANRVLVNAAPLTQRQGSVLVRQGKAIMNANEWSLLGEHNLDNAAMAIEAALLCGAEISTAVEAVRSFRPLDHRLELVVVDTLQRRWLNDSIATTPHATLAALQALSDQPVVLIAGGYVRPADWRPVLEHCRLRPLAGLIVLPDSGPDVAHQFLSADDGCCGRVIEARNMVEAVQAAAGLADREQVVLLSPGAASFPYFRDFEDRGNAFKDAVEKL